MIRRLSLAATLATALLLAPARPAAQQPEALWAVQFTTGPAWDTTRAPTLQPGFASHSRNLNRLRTEGRIVLGGRYGPVGLIVVRAADEADARSLLAPDSSLMHGSFQAAVHRWRTIYAGQVGAP